MGIRTNLPSSNSTVWVCDATIDMDYAESLMPNAKDETPEGHVKLAKAVIQFPQDKTRKAKQGPFQDTLRGLLAMYPHHKRVGLITHSTLTGAVKTLGERFVRRIVQTTYYGSGSDRASNEWYTQCDLLIVAGTPRVSPMAVQQRLCKLGDFDAAGTDGEWGEIQWRGRTVTGKERIVRGRGYQNLAWQKAHRSLVRSAIVQAVGRSRGVMENGCDAIVVTNEECGLPLADRELIPNLTEKHCEAARLVAELSALDASKIGGPRAVSTKNVAEFLGVGERDTRYILTELEQFQMVRRVGERGGWLPET